MDRKKNVLAFFLLAGFLMLIPLIGAPAFEVKQQELTGTLDRTVSSTSGDNLVLYLSFDEGDGNITGDLSNFNNTGELGNSSTGDNTANPSWTIDSHPMYSRGYGLAFDGVDDWVNISKSESLNITGNYTIEMWLYPILVGDNFRYFIWSSDNVDDGFYARIDQTTNKITFREDATNDTTSSTALSANNWYHFAVSFDGSSLNMYINGKLDATGTFSGIQGNDNDLFIGMQDPSQDLVEYNGTIDEVRIYNTSLSAEEIYNHYKDRIGIYLNYTLRSEPYVCDRDTVALYHLDGNTKDSCGNNDGTLTTGDLDGNYSYGRFGYGVDFDGVDDFVNVTYSESLNFTGNDFTLSAWIKANSLKMATIVDRFPSSTETSETGYRINVRSDEEIWIEYGRAGTASKAAATNAYSIGSWVHVVGVRKGDTLEIYIDGLLKNSNTASLANVNTDNNLQIGNPDTWNEYFNGTIDEVRISNKSRTLEEIREYYRQGSYRHDEFDSNETVKWLNISWRDNTEVQSDGNTVLLMHFDEEACYDNETEILTRKEIKEEELENFFREGFFEKGSFGEAFSQKGSKDFDFINIDDDSGLVNGESEEWMFANNLNNQYNNNGVGFNFSVVGSTSKPSDSNTMTPNNILSTKSEIQTGNVSSLSFNFIQALPLVILTIPAPVLTSSSDKALISNSSANLLGKTVRVAPVSTNALTTLECFLSKSDNSISTYICPILQNNEIVYLNVLVKESEFKNILNNKNFDFIDGDDNSKLVNNDEKENKNGFHSSVIATRQNLVSTRTINNDTNSYKNFLVSEKTKLGSHSLVIAPDLRSGVLRGHAGSNSLSDEMDFPLPASNYNIIVLLKDYEIELNKDLEYLEDNNKDLDFIYIDDDSGLVNDDVNKGGVFKETKYNNQNNFLDLRYLTNSSVLNILTIDCCLNATSSDQIDELNANAKAKYGTSLLPCSPCGDISLASDKNSLYTSSGKDSIFISNKDNKNANASSSILPNFFIFSDSLDNSSKTYLGEISLHPELDNLSMIVLLAESFLKKENNIEASTTNILGSLFDICSYKPCLLATLSLSSEPHFKASSSVILESFNNSLATLNINLSDNFSFIALENTELISSLLSSLKPNFNSSGISTFTSAILISPKNDTLLDFLNILKDNLPNCNEVNEGYCKENGKIYKLEWKYFENLSKEDEVMTLNQSCVDNLGDARTSAGSGVERGEAPSCKEWQKPNEYYEYDFDKEMFRIESEEGELVVSPKHKVYISGKDYLTKNISTNSGVEYTLISSCSLNESSLDQIAQPNFIASAKYGTSLLCGANLSALDCISGENLIIGNISILSLIISNDSIISDLDTSQISAITSMFLLNSSARYDVATNFNSSTKNNSCVFPLPIIAANRTVASTTNCIYLASLNRLATASDILSVNSLATLSETLILGESNLSRFNFSALSDIAFAATSDQLSLNSCIVLSNSLGIGTDNVGILKSPNLEDSNGYINISYLILCALADDSDLLNDNYLICLPLGGMSRELYENLSENATSFVYNPCNENWKNCSGEKNDLGINFEKEGEFGSFGESGFSSSIKAIDKLSGYRLIEIKDIYSLIENGSLKVNDLSFLDSELNEIKIINISKIPYDGKIYDIDVPNDIILVRRRNDDNKGREILNGFEKGEALSDEDVGNDIVLVRRKNENKFFHESFSEKVSNEEKEKKNQLAFNTLLKPMIVNPTILFDFSEYLATIPEPKSKLNAGCGLPNDMYNTSASLSYSQDTCLGFSTINVSILSSYLLDYLNSKQSIQNQQLDLPHDKQLQDTYYQLLEFYCASLQPEEFQYLLAAQDQDYLEYLKYYAHSLSSLGVCHKYVLDVLLSNVLEHRSLKTLSSFNYDEFRDYLKVLEEPFLEKNVHEKIKKPRKENEKPEYLIVWSGNSNNETIDDSGLNNNGTLGNSSSGDDTASPIRLSNVEDCIQDSCLQFDGVDDFVNVSLNATIIATENFTFEGWIKTAYNNKHIISTYDVAGPDNNYYISVTSGGLLEFYGKGYSDTTTDSVNRIDTDKWVHFAITYDHINRKVYINGIEDNSEAATGDMTTDDHPTYIGAGYWNAQITSVFNGTIESVVIYNRSLTASEIKEHYLKGRQRLYLQTRTSDDNITWSSWSGNKEIPQYHEKITNDTNSENGTLLLLSFDGKNLAGSDTSANYPRSGDERSFKGYFDEFRNKKSGRYVDLNDSNLMGYWKLDELINNGSDLSEVIDYSGKGNDGTGHNGTGAVEIGLVNGMVGNAMSFDGVDDYVQLPESSSLDIRNPSITLMAWVKRDDITSYVIPIAKRLSNNPGVRLQYQLHWASSGDGNANKIVFTINNEVTTAKSDNAHPDTGWHHIASTYDGSNIRLYFDGVLDGTAAATASIDNLPSDIFIGTDNAGTYSNHTYDEVIIYNRSLSVQEIKAHALNRYYSKEIKVEEDKGKFFDSVYLSKENKSVLSYPVDNKINKQNLILDCQFDSRNIDGSYISSLGYDDTSPSHSAYICEDGERLNFTYIDNLVAVDGLVSAWKFEDNSSSDKMGINNGLMEGGLDCTNDEGYLGYGCLFDGSNDFVNITDSQSLNDTGNLTNLTLEAWVKGNEFSSSSYNHIIDKNSQYILTVYQNKLSMYLSGAGGGWWYGTKVLDTGRWYYVVGTSDNITKNLYVDGVLVNSSTETGYLDANSGALSIGAAGGVGGYNFNGSIDEVAIYNRTLSEEEIQAHYNLKKGKYSEGVYFDGGVGKGSLAIKSEDINVDVNKGTVSLWLNFDNTLTADNSAFTLWPTSGQDTHKDVFNFDLHQGVRAIWYSNNVGTTYHYITTYSNTNLLGTGWHHVTFTWTNSEGKLYFDGNLKNVDSDVTTPPNVGYKGYIGSYASGTGPTIASWFNGTIDAVKIYDKVLTSDEIYQEYLGNINISQGTVKFYFKSDWSGDNNESYYLYSLNDQDKELVLNLDFDEGQNLIGSDTSYFGNTTYDLSGNKNNGELGNSSSGDNTASPIWNESGRYNYALEFDGVDDWINLTNTSASTLEVSEISIEAWVKTIFDGNVIYVYYPKGAHSDGRGVVFRTSSFTKGSADGSWEGVNFATNVSDGNWHHIAGTYSGSTMKVYVDGNLDNTATVDTQGISWTDGAGTNPPEKMPTIGNSYNGVFTDFFNGTIDSVRIYNRSLSAKEIKDRYNERRFSIFKGGDNEIHVDLGNASLSYNVENLTANNWSHLALTWKDKENISLYFNDELMDSKEVSVNGMENLTSLMFIGSNAYGTQQCDCYIDDFGIYNYVVSNDTIKDKGYYDEKGESIAGNISNFTQWRSGFHSKDIEGSPVLNNVTLKYDRAPRDYSITDPINGTYFSITNITIAISNGSDPDEDDDLINNIIYLLEVDNDSDFSSPEYVNYSIAEILETNDTTTKLNDSMYFARVIGYDGYINGTEVIVVFTVGTVAPTIPVLVLPENNTITTNTTPYLVWEDVNETNFANYTVEVDDNINFDTVDYRYFVTDQLGNSTQITSGWATDKRWYWHVIAYDLEGFSNESQVFEYVIDIAIPTVNLNSPSNNSWDSDGNITFEYIPVDVTLDTCELWHNGTGEFSLNQSTINPTTSIINTFTNILHDDYFEWNVKCNDSSNNVGWAANNLTLNVDIVLPEINLDYPNDNLFMSNENVTFNYTLTENNLQVCELWVNESGSFILNETELNPVNGSTYNFTELSFLEGQFIWNVRCNETSSRDNWNNSNFTFGIDQTFPLIDFSSDTLVNNTYINSNTIYVNVSINETNEQNITFTLVDTTSIVNETTYTDNSRIINWSLDNLNEIYYYNVSIADKANNLNDTETRIITLDNTTPLIDYGSETLANNTYVNQDSIYVNWTFNETNLDSIETYLYSSTDLENKSEFTIATTEINVTPINLNDIYTYYTFINDSAGNENKTDNRTLTLDNTRPSAFNLLTSNNNTFSTNRTPFLDWEDTSDTNFDNYSIEISNNSDFSSIDYTYDAAIDVTNSSYQITTNLVPDNTHYWRVIAIDKANNQRNSTDFFTYSTDNIEPSISNVVKEPDESYMLDNVTINVTVTDTNLDAVWIESNHNGSLVNYSSAINEVTVSGSVYSYYISYGNFSNQQLINYSWYANDSAGNENLSDLNTFTIVNLLPSIPSLTSPTNNTWQIFDRNADFDWDNATDTENNTEELSYEFELYNNTALNETYLVKALNTSDSNYTILSSEVSTFDISQHYWQVRTYDGINYSNYSNLNYLDVVYAVINITTPDQGQVLSPNNAYTINVVELDNEDWMNRSVVEILGDSRDQSYTMSNTSDDEVYSNYTYSYTVPNINSTILTITAYAFNDSVNDSSLNVSDTITVKVTNPVSVSISDPVITSVKTNPSYVEAGNNVNVESDFDLDVLINDVNISIEKPDGSNEDLSDTLSIDGNSSNSFVYEYNATFNASLEGNYIVYVEVTDLNYPNSNLVKENRTVESKNLTSVNITGIGVSTINLKDISSKRSLYSGSSVTTDIPLGQYDVEVAASAITMELFNMTVDESLTNLCNYTDIDETVTITSTQRAIDQIDEACGGVFDNVNLTYNYTIKAGSITYEENLRLYKCESTSSCTWEGITAVRDADNNIIIGNFSNFSLFMLSEDTITTTTTTAAAGATGGTTTKEKLFSLDIVSPGPISLYSNETIIMPLTIKNSGDYDLIGIRLGAISGDGLGLEFDIDYISQLLVDQEFPLELTIRGNNLKEGNYKITIKADVTDPEFSESVDFFINLLEFGLGKKDVKEQILLLKSLLEGNPECLELKEILTQAEGYLEKGESQKAYDLAKSAVSACKELVASRQILKAPKKVNRELLLLIGEIFLFLIMFSLVYNYYRRRQLMRKF